MRTLDPRSWNLVASGLALAACQADNPDTPDDDNYDDGVYECYYLTDCGFGSRCVANACEPALDATECVYESLVEIPVPQLEPALAVTLADFDGDGRDELLTIGASGISVVLADDSVVLTPWPETHDYAWVSAIELQADGALDLVVGFPNGMLVLAGSGDGSFIPLTTLESLPEITTAQALDPDGDGVDQLLAVPTNSTAIWFDDVLTGSWQPTGYHGSSPIVTNLIGTDDSPPEIVFDNGCSLDIVDSTTFDRLGQLYGPEVGQSCIWEAAILANVGNALISIGVGPVDTVQTQLNIFDFPTFVGASAMIPDLRATTSALVDLYGAGEGAGAPALVLASDSSLALVWDWIHFPKPCVDHLEGGADQLLTGDRDGDGREELAILRQGAIRLLHLP